MPPDVSSLSGGSLLVAWQLKDKHVLIVGGGDVASGRIESVLVADARITLIAPRAGLHPQTKAYIDATPRITWHDRIFAGEEDLDGVDMVLSGLEKISLGVPVLAARRNDRLSEEAGGSSSKGKGKARKE